jgi:hypothetical protein
MKKTSFASQSLRVQSYYYLCLITYYSKYKINAQNNAVSAFHGSFSMLQGQAYKHGLGLRLGTT